MKTKLFTRPGCSQCPIAKMLLKKFDHDFEEINIDTPDGEAQARKYKITSLPTAIFYLGPQIQHVATGVSDIEAAAKPNI